MSVKHHGKIASHSEFELQLIERGFTCGDRSKFDKECEKDTKNVKWKSPPRFTYERGSIRVLTDSSDRPYRTVQRIARRNVIWYVDFPLEVNLEAIFTFILHV